MPLERIGKLVTVFDAFPSLRCNVLTYFIGFTQLMSQQFQDFNPFTVAYRDFVSYYSNCCRVQWLWP